MDINKDNLDRRTKPPVIIAIFCILVIIAHGADLFRSLKIDRFLDLMTYTPFWYLLLVLFGLYPFEIFGLIEIWKMRRRGLFIFGLAQFIWLVIWIFYFNLLPHYGHISRILVFIIIIIIYYKKME